MEGLVAVLLVALNAGADVALATYVALKLPASLVDLLEADDGLEEDGVKDALQFGDDFRLVHKRGA